MRRGAVTSTSTAAGEASGGRRRAGERITWLVLTVGLATAAATIVTIVVQRPHPTATPHVPWWVLAVGFAIAELDGVVSPRRRTVSSSTARIPLVIGLVLDLPVELLMAHVVGTVVVWPLRDGRRLSAKLFDLAGSTLATAIGVATFLWMSDATSARGPEGWIDALVAAGAVTGVSLLLAATRDRMWDRSGVPLTRWVAGLVVSDGVGIAIGLVATEVLRSDRYAAWLLVAPALTALVVRQRFRDAAWRADALTRLHDVAGALHRSASLEAAVATVTDHAQAVARAGSADLVVTAGQGEVVTAAADGRQLEVRRCAATEDDRWLLSEGHVSDGRRWRRRSVTVVVQEHGITTGALRVVHREGPLGWFRRSEVEVLETLAAGLGLQLETIRRLDDLADQRRRDHEVMRRLEEVNREVERISGAKSVFLAMTSHELRAPLAALLMEAQVLGQLIPDTTGNEQVRRLVGGVDANARHLLRLVDDLLDLSRIEAGQLELRVRDVDLAEVAAAVVAALRPLADADGVELTLATSGALELRGDADRLWQVLANLVDNAVKATPRGGRVAVVVDRRDTVPEVVVSDTGTGIADEDLERIFEPFEQGAAARRGLGLGLPIARHLVERHGGTLHVETRRDVGSRFVVRLAPAGAAAADRTVASAGHTAAEQPQAVR
jgi:signal transduction histidine kinase